jgi:UDP-N-acetylmuramyl pentapeptide phosphotransferase/UDP-N-acetylglucosamine-1-phosphate transferase
MSSGFSFSKYSGIAATAAWTLGWFVVACLAGAHQFSNQNNPSDVIDMSATSRDGTALVNLIVAVIATVLGGFVTIRMFSRRNQVEKPYDKPTHESAARRLTGWLAAVAWCAVAVIWNLSVLSCLIRAAREGQSVLMLMMIPFSLIGFFLLLTLFVSLGFAIDSLLHLGQRSDDINEK